ncbi:hypothetical protein ACFL4W_02930 [Planctomycetota bacterium]
MELMKLDWQRDGNNPVLPPVDGSMYDSMRCMNPFAVIAGDTLRLYYAGADDNGKHRICLAEAPLDRPTAFIRKGVILDNGAEGAFDGHWCVIPCVHKFGETWHLYYSGNEGSDLGLQSFPGIGLATSTDGVTFERYSDNPVITGNMTAEFPDNRGVAGGGTILEDIDDSGTITYRMYYTVASGTKNEDVMIDQEKHCAVCHSTDGITWTDHRIILSPRRDVGNEDIAVAAPFVWHDGEHYRMIYCGIGTKWGYYSMSEAVSQDGYIWDRGEGDGNLSLLPGEKGSWEEQMVEYPSVIPMADEYRLYYCGNGYGSTGIGTAVAEIRKANG